MVKNKKRKMGEYKKESKKREKKKEV